MIPRIMRNQSCLPTLCATLLLSLLGYSVAFAQNEERWFQIEMSVFSNEDTADRESEYWSPGQEPLRYPGSMQRLRELMDLLAIDDLLLVDATLPVVPFTTPQQAPAVQTVEDYIQRTGPHPASRGNGFAFFDFARDPYIRLPTSASNLQQTNQALERSPEHRLLYTAVWRQPVQGTADAVPLYVSGGESYGGTPELQGSVTIRFNANADRVVVDADLWLSEFSSVVDSPANWELPVVPARVRRNYEQVSNEEELDFRIRRIYQLRQSRDMRSTEFHYLDHPALGVVITVDPYEVPAVIPDITEPELPAVIPDITEPELPQ